jgi:hypothetical protein
MMRPRQQLLHHFVLASKDSAGFLDGWVPNPEENVNEPCLEIGKKTDGMSLACIRLELAI